MESTFFLLLVVSLTSTGAFFLISFVLSLRKDILWLKFMAFGLLDSAVSCTLIPYRSDMVIAAYFFIGLAALFYWAYRLIKK